MKCFLVFTWNLLICFVLVFLVFTHCGHWAIYPPTGYLCTLMRFPAHCLLWAEESQLSLPLLLGQVAQSPAHLTVPCLDCTNVSIYLLYWEVETLM